MTTELATKNYERLDNYIDRILTQAQKTGELIQEYLNVAKEERIPEVEAWRYLKSKVPKTTYYRLKPLELKDPNKQNRNKVLEDSGPSGTKTPSEFNTEGMGIVITDDEPPETHPKEEITQSVNCPADTSTDTFTDEERDRLIAKIQEKEKMISDLSFQKASDTSPITPPAEQIIIVPHQMILELDKKRRDVTLSGIYKLQTENNIVIGIEVVNVQ